MKYLESLPGWVKWTIVGIAAFAAYDTGREAIQPEMGKIRYASTSLEADQKIPSPRSERKFMPPADNSFREGGRIIVRQKKCAVAGRGFPGGYINGFLIKHGGNFHAIEIKTKAGNFMGPAGKDICAGFTPEELMLADVPFTACGLDLEAEQYKEKECYTGFVRQEED